MRVGVCGGRLYDDTIAVWTALDDLLLTVPHDTLEIVQGGAPGADKIAREWCVAREVPYFNVPADWKRHGRSAGPIRNQKIVDEYALDKLLAFSGGRGTADMVRRAMSAGIPVQQCM